jgi:hypothetical protein
MPYVSPPADDIRAPPATQPVRMCCKTRGTRASYIRQTHFAQGTQDCRGGTPLGVASSRQYTRPSSDTACVHASTHTCSYEHTQHAHTFFCHTWVSHAPKRPTP